MPGLNPRTERLTAATEAPSDRYVNRELSWLEFNHRVLNEARDPRTPLLERVTFLSIFTSNLDEFMMKRVGLLKRKLQAGLIGGGESGLTNSQLLTAIRGKIRPMLAQQADLYACEILPALAAAGVRILRDTELSESQQAEAQAFFRSRVFPVLTPLSVDPGHPFPFISNLSTSLGVTLRQPGREEKYFARVKIPEVLPSFVPLRAADGERHAFVSLLDLTRRHLADLFPGMEIIGVMPFRVTRNADVEQEPDDTEDLLDQVEQALRQRKFERAVRLEHGPDPDAGVLEYLLSELELSPEDVYEMPGLLDYRALKPVGELQEPRLRYEPWIPLRPKVLADDEADIFAIIRGGDLLVHHPYESFDASIERFIRRAADDPAVLAIKITLYRTGDDSPFILSLIRAAEAGKQVVAVVEIKARFDEQRNIHLAQALEQAGVHVVYGFVGTKTHTKIALVVRADPDALRCYAHIGTGNYHVQTAKLYTDLSLLTCQPEVTGDVVDLFHFLTGRSLKREYRKLLVAPVNMMERFVQMIDGEIANRRAGKPARIVAKINSLESREIGDALYRASQAGVPVDLIVRGFCCLRPGVPGLSENIRVISVIGRFLEHARVFHFAAGAEDPRDGTYLIGSADWMYRNLYGRIEVVTPIEDRSARARIWEVLNVMLSDRRQAWEMKPDGSYAQRRPAPGDTGAMLLGTHQALMDLTRQTLLSEAERTLAGGSPAGSGA